MALELQGPERPEEGPAEAEATEEAEEEASAWEAAEEELAEEAQDTASVWQLAMAAPDPDETTKYQNGKSNEEAQGAESETEKGKFNKNQEEPEKNLGPAEGGP